MLSQVEEALQWCTAEQAKLNVNIQLHRDILKSLTLQTRRASPDLDEAHKGSAEDVVQLETEEIELVERALKEALRIRSISGTASSRGPRCGRDPPRPNKEPGRPAVVKPSETNDPTSGTGTGKRASSGSSSPARPVARLRSKTGRRGGPVGSVRARSASSAEVKREECARAGRDPVDPGAARASEAPPGAAGARVAAPHVWRAEDAGTAGSTPPQSRIPSDLTAKWKSLRMKQNRLWDKVMLMQSQEVPERSAFMEKMGACFPKTWPQGSPDQTAALMDSLTRQGQDLSHCYQVQKLLTQHGSPPGTQPDSEELQSAPDVTLENLGRRAASLRTCTVQVKKEWEAWERWRPEGGGPGPDGGGVGGQAGGAPVLPLPPAVTVGAEAELVELERLRLRVLLLQQEVHLQQALSVSLSPQLPSLLGRPGPPDCTVLRDVYSLLAEGGELFPALVLDTEPD